MEAHQNVDCVPADAIGRRAFCAAIVCAASLMGCSKRKDQFHTIKWTGGPLINTARFYFNGADLGEGQAGFATLLEEIKAIPDTVTVKIYYPPEALPYFEDNYHYFTGLPLLIGDSEHEQWVELARSKQLQFIH